MAPTFLNSLRRRSRASFRTNRSATDTSSDGAASQGESPSSGSLTPPSIDIQSDPALHLQVKDQHLQRRQSQISHSQSQQQIVQRPPLTSSSNRNSVSGMSGLGAPSTNGRQALPSSPYAPRLVNITENAWVCLGCFRSELLYGSSIWWRTCKCKPCRQGFIAHTMLSMHINSDRFVYSNHC
jgi:hypothetical protein